jgi:RNA polymerase sigma-70 factor (ECF subfamily)
VKNPAASASGSAAPLEAAHDRRDHERVAPAQALHHLEHGRGQRADHRLGHALHLRGFERAEREERVGPDPCERVAGADLLAAVRRDHEGAARVLLVGGGSVAGARRRVHSGGSVGLPRPARALRVLRAGSVPLRRAEAIEQPGGELPCPLAVVEQDERRLLGRAEGVEQGNHGFDRAGLAEVVGSEQGRALGRKHLREPGQRRGSGSPVVGGKPRQAPRERGVVVGGPRDLRRHPGQRAEGLLAHPVATLATKDPGALALGPVRELVEQPRLAAARLAGEQDEQAAALPGLLEAFRERPELADAAHEDRLRWAQTRLARAERDFGIPLAGHQGRSDRCEVVGDRPGGLVAVLGVRAKQAPDELVQRSWDLGHEHPQVGRGQIRLAPAHLFGGRAGEEGRAGEALEQHKPEGVQVGAFIGTLAGRPGLLRSLVAGAGEGPVGGGALPPGCGHRRGREQGGSGVLVRGALADRTVPRHGEHDARRGKSAVDGTRPVERRERLGEVDAHLEGIEHREGPAREPGFEGRPGHERGRDDERTAVGDDVEHSAEASVGRRAQRRSLVVEAGPGGRADCAEGAEHDRDVRSGREVARPRDPYGRRTSQRTQHDVAPGEHPFVGDESGVDARRWPKSTARRRASDWLSAAMAGERCTRCSRRIFRCSGTGSRAPTRDPVRAIDDEVVARARAGEREALGGLFRCFQPPLLRYLAVRGARAPEDLAQDVWMEVARSLARFEGHGADFPRWLFTIARRRLCDERRFRARREEPAALPDEPADPADGPEELAVARAALRRALALLRRLPPDQAEVVALRAVAGLSVAEVAQVVGKTHGAVRVLAHRGLARLAALVEADAAAEREGPSPRAPAPEAPARDAPARDALASRAPAPEVDRSLRWS